LLQLAGGSLANAHMKKSCRSPPSSEQLQQGPSQTFAVGETVHQFFE
jgi:hypothetical protein